MLPLFFAPLLGLAAPAAGQVRLNEIMAAPSERLLAADAQGRMRPGTGKHWTDLPYSAPGWQTGKAPLGYGFTGLGTNVQNAMRNRTPTLYLRKSFIVQAGEMANEGVLQLRVTFDDGFVAYLNGKEAARANCGPEGHYLYHDQPAYNFATAVTDSAYNPTSQPGVGGTQPMVIPLGRVSDWLAEGANVLAVQLHNREPGTKARLDASLEIVVGDAVFELARHDFDEANGAFLTHRNVSGAVTNVMDGTPPTGSWLAAAPLPQSGAAWSDLTLRTTLASGAGGGGSGALRYEHTQAGANQPALLKGPPISLAPRLTSSSLTEADLASLTATFRFRASAGVDYALRLDPEEDSTGANSLTGLPALTPTAGTAAAETAPDTFADSVGSVRTRTVNAAGTGSTASSGTTRNTLTLFNGPAMRDFAFAVTENNLAGEDAEGGAGHLSCEVTKAASESDFYGFSMQGFQVRSWTSGSITPGQLENVTLVFHAHLPTGHAVRLYLEPSTATATEVDRLSLGTITGTGGWQAYELHPAAGLNQLAFLARMNGTPTTSVRVVFRSDAAQPLGTRWRIDNLGFVPWRTYTASLSAGSNAAAFVAALKAQPSPRFYPVFEKNGLTTSPSWATVTLDNFTVTYTKANAGTAQTLVPAAAADWAYFVGRTEPSGGVFEPADLASTTVEAEFSDWIELFNASAAPVDLTGWSLTDDANVPRKWTFPAGASIGPQAALLVLADGRAAPTGAHWLHASFSLSGTGEYLALIDAAGTPRDALDPMFPEQNAFHSYGRNQAGEWGFFREATPNAPNSGPWTAGRADTPDFSPQGGFHTGPITLTLSTLTPGAVIRYTIDGAEPTEANSLPYEGPFTIYPINNKTGTVVRARAFKSGLMPSNIRTNTYLIDQHANLKARPAVLLSGDPGEVFYKPLGIFSINGGTYDSSNLWRAAKASDYNIPGGSGRFIDPDAANRPYERMAQLEILRADGLEGLREKVGIRVSSSPWSRPQLRLTQTQSASPLPNDPTQKPSLNVFFRNDYGASSITYPLIPETGVQTFGEFRLRAGKNDISNPFIRDELTRRLYTDMGQVGTVGGFVSLYLNGSYKGYYNLVERIREPFMQSHHKSTQPWDVNYINGFESGDNVHFNTVLRPRLQANLTLKANYDALAAVLDMENAADYYLLNIYTAMWDWPQNNWAMARERSATGLWRCYVWDAEGSFNMGGHSAAYNMFTDTSAGDALLTGSSTLSYNFQRLMSSPEWRLLFADRVQKHLFNGGALTDARLTARKNACQEEIRPLMAFAGISTPDSSWFTAWLNASSGRRRYLFPRNAPGQAGYQAGQLRDPNSNGNLNDTLWPLTLPPGISHQPGQVPANTAVELTHSAPASSVIYYTVDGSDPRLWGGATASSALTYTSPIVLASSSVTVKARVKNGDTGEWSPITEAAYLAGTVPASADNIVISELMYHPADPSAAEIAAGFTDPEDFEFLSLRNIGPSPADLSGIRFVTGITFDFATAARRVLDPGKHLVIGRRHAALLQRYGAGINAILAGEFFGNLSNSGETLRLETTANAAVIKEFTYSDSAPWPKNADGRGSSLVLLSPSANPDHNIAAHWKASDAAGGHPLGPPETSTAYDAWLAGHFTAAELADPAVSGPAADPDHDGWPNQLEFVLTSAPKDTASQPAVTWTWSAGQDGTPQLEVTLRKLANIGTLALLPQWSADLKEWHADFTLVSTTSEGEAMETQTWRATAPASSGQFFARLQSTTVN